MASWQAKAYSNILRLYLKRRPLSDPAANVAFERRRFDPPQWMRVPPPQGTLVRDLERRVDKGEWETWGELVSWQNDSASRAVYFLHGGGYVFGKAATYRLFTSALARRLQARVFAADYRLAPEHPFPAALDDAVRGYLEIFYSVQQQAERIVLVGDSAGGGLVLALLLKLRELGHPLPAAAIALSPWTDLACQSDSITTNETTDVMFYADTIRGCAPHYHQDQDPRLPFISPVYGDLTGLPPLQLFASHSEALRDDAIRFAERARAQGVTTELHLYEGMPHVWPVFAFLPEAKQALNQIEQFTQAHWPRV
jgi:epsilon-lactone hydrolase